MRAPNQTLNCKFCNRKTTKGCIRRHEDSCYLNPDNEKLCPVCKEKIKNLVSTTCSYSCANTKFRTGESHGNWKSSSYRSTCFLHHEKECVVCGENKIVAVHHLNENKKDNRPENLIPMCPTHHLYMHSGFKKLIKKDVDEYLTKWKMKTIK